MWRLSELFEPGVGGVSSWVPGGVDVYRWDEFRVAVGGNANDPFGVMQEPVMLAAE